MLGAFIYKSLCGLMFSFFLGKYLGIEWLDHMVDVCLTFEETAKLFSEVFVPYTFPPAAVYEECQLFHILGTLDMVSIFHISHSNNCVV